MKIIFVCKRYYTGKDLVRDRFGRLYQMPVQLARLGHEVVVICLDYRNADPLPDLEESFPCGSLHWSVLSFRDILSKKLPGLYRRLRSKGPDLILGSSDIPCLWLTRRLAAKFGCPYVVDLYDNYESFGQARIPFFRWALRDSIQNAAAVVTVSEALKRKVIEDYIPSGSVTVMSNGVDPCYFFSSDQGEARLALGLPSKSLLIGTAGNLSSMKGLDCVYRAWAKLEPKHENLYLVLAGPVDARLPIPEGPRVIYLGTLAEIQVGCLFQALDVGIIPAQDSEFGRYCFPQKLYEMVACGLPFVAAEVGAIADTLQNCPYLLYRVNNPDDLANRIVYQLRNRRLADLTPKFWPELVGQLNETLIEVT